MELSESQNQRIKGILNEGVKNSSGVLNDLLSSNIEMSMPSLFTLSLSPQVKAILQRELDEGDLTSVSLKFTGKIDGAADLILTTESAINLVNYLTGMNPEADEYEEFVQETLNEIGNIVLNSVCGTVSNVIGDFIEYQVPTFAKGNFEKILFKNFEVPDKTIFMGKTNFEVKELSIVGMITMILDDSSVKTILSSFEKQAQ